MPAQALCTAAQQGQWRDEGWRLRKDGSRFWASVLISPLLGVNGEVLGFSKVTRDMTQRREGEQRLVESERNLRLLVETVQDYAIFSLDCHGVITSWNRGAQRIKGYTAQEAIGKHFSVFYEPPEVARGWPQEELARATERGRFEDEGWRVRKDGTRFWANVVITAIKDEQGQLLGFSKVTRDLTERRRHEQQLREREESLRLLVEGVRDHAMFLLDAQGRIKVWNAGGQRLLGYDSSEVLERDASMFYPQEDRLAGKPQAELASARSAGHLLVEGWRQRADGTTFWAEVTTTRLDGDGDTPRGFIRIVRDLTERRRAETLEMEGRRLSEFIAVLSHELRNPLAPIRNAVAILDRFTSEPQARWCLDLLGRQIAHMSRLVDDLLDVSRITSGKIRLEPRRAGAQHAGAHGRRHGQRDGQAAWTRTDRTAGASADPDHGRHHAADAGRGQPAHQCRQVHAAARAHRRQRQQRWRYRHAAGVRQRHRHERIPAAAGLQAFRAGCARA